MLNPLCCQCGVVLSLCVDILLVLGWGGNYAQKCQSEPNFGRLYPAPDRQILKLTSSGEQQHICGWSEGDEESIARFLIFYFLMDISTRQSTDKFFVVPL